MKLYRFPQIALAFLLFAGLLLTGCDAVSDTQSENATVVEAAFGGLWHRAEGAGELSLNEKGHLLLKGQGAKGLLIDTKGHPGVDLIFEPISIEQGGELTVDFVSEEASSQLARLFHRVLDGEQERRVSQIEVDLSGINSTGMMVNFYQEDRLLYQAKYNKIAMRNPVATTEDGPTSFHYVNENGVTKIVWDYEENTGGTADVVPAGTKDPLAVSHVVVTPIHPGQPDWGGKITGIRLEAEGVEEVVMKRAGVRKAGLGLGSLFVKE